LGKKKTQRKSGVSVTHSKRQKMLHLKALDTKKHRAKGASATHNTENKKHCVLGSLDTKNKVEGG
jgi:hypothetical protein